MSEAFVGAIEGRAALPHCHIEQLFNHLGDQTGWGRNLRRLTPPSTRADRHPLTPIVHRPAALGDPRDAHPG